MNQKQLNNDLKQFRKAERENKRTMQSETIQNLMKHIENERITLYEKGAVQYTQEYIANKAGIARCTYSTFINKSNDSIKVTTLLSLADVLGMKCTINFESAHTKDTPDTL